MKEKEIEVKEKVDSLSLIENLNSGAIAGTLGKINQFQQVVQAQFIQGHDFGIIPGTGSKPTMLKPGAEKIVMLLGLTSEFQILESTRDFDQGFFQYQIKCQLKKNGFVVTEGIGSANTRERKYIKGDPYTLDNTVLKMAKKRALVDAALLVGSLSSIFTQDIEDMDLAGNQASTYQRTYTDQDGTISKAQARRMYAMSGGSEEICKEVLAKYGYTSSTEVKKTDYEKICQEVEALAKQG